VGEHDDDDPNDLIVSGAWLVGGAIDDHPDPKAECGDQDQKEQ
jgi:hypothetical protein